MNQHLYLWIQSENATCEVSSTVPSVTGTTEIQEVTSLTPRQKSCDSEGELNVSEESGFDFVKVLFPKAFFQ